MTTIMKISNARRVNIHANFNRVCLKVVTKGLKHLISQMYVAIGNLVMI